MIRWLLDLIFAALLAALAGVAVFTLDGPLRIALVLPTILFVPGYAFLSVLFPEGSRLSRSRDNRRTWGSQNRSRQGRGRQRNQSDDAFLLGKIERLALSVALSLALVSLIVFGLNFTVGFSTRRIATMILGFTGAMIIFAIARRVVLPVEERYVIEFSRDDLPLDTSFVGMFAVSLVVLAASVGFFALAAPASQASTEFFILGENETTGNMSVMASDDAIVNGEPVTIKVKNNGAETKTYTVVVTLESLENGEVTSTEEIDRFPIEEVGGGETKRITEYDEAPDEGGRVVFYFYNGNAPPNPSAQSADQRLRYYLSTNSSEQDGENNGGGENGDGEGMVSVPSMLGQHPLPAVAGRS